MICFGCIIGEAPGFVGAMYPPPHRCMRPAYIYIYVYLVVSWFSASFCSGVADVGTLGAGGRGGSVSGVLFLVSCVTTSKLLRS